MTVAMRQGRGNGTQKKVVVSNICYFHPEPWGNDPIWLIFQMGGSTTNQQKPFPWAPWRISKGWLRNWRRWVWAQRVGEWQCAARVRISDLSGNNCTCRGGGDFNWYKQPLSIIIFCTFLPEILLHLALQSWKLYGFSRKDGITESRPCWQVLVWFEAQKEVGGSCVKTLVLKLWIRIRTSQIAK